MRDKLWGRILLTLGAYALGVLAWFPLLLSWAFVGSKLWPDELPFPPPQPPIPITNAPWLLGSLVVDGIAAAVMGQCLRRFLRERLSPTAWVFAGLMVIGGFGSVYADEGIFPLWLPLTRTVLMPIIMLAAARPLSPLEPEPQTP